MINSEQVAHNNMLREIEGLSYCGDVQDDAETTHTWIDANRENPIGSDVLGCCAKRYYVPLSDIIMLHGLRR